MHKLYLSNSTKPQEQAEREMKEDVEIQLKLFYFVPE